MKKNMTLRFASLALALALVGGFAHNSFAAEDMNGQQMTKEQMATMDKLVQQYYTNNDATRQALTVKRAELAAQMNSTNPDSKKLQSLSREIGELEGKLLAARTELNNQLRKEGLPGCPGLGNGRGYHRHGMGGYGAGCYGAGCDEMGRGHGYGHNGHNGHNGNGRGRGCGNGGHNNH